MIFVSILNLSWLILAQHGLQDAFKTPPRAPKTPPRAPKTPPRAFKMPPRRSLGTPKSLIFLSFFNGFAFLGLLGTSLTQHGLQDAFKTLHDDSQNLQDASKMLQDASQRPPDALKTAKITFKTPPRPPNTSARGFQMPPRRSSSPPRPQKPPQEASTCLQDAQYRFQDPAKCSSAAPKFYFLTRFMPSPCQFPKYARDVCPQRPSTMADCQIRGRLPRVVWRWFARVGRLRSARPPW